MDRCTLQNPFLADLVSLADPTYAGVSRPARGDPRRMLRYSIIAPLFSLHDRDRLTKRSTVS